MNRDLWSSVLAGLGLLLLLLTPGEGPHAKQGQTGAPKAPRQTTVFYVATDGNDAWSGRRQYPNAQKTDGPFATLTRARNAIRQLKAQGKFSSPVEVRLSGGVYTLTEPLVFTPEDSGTPDNPIVYAAVSGEAPVLSGGREIRRRVTSHAKDSSNRLDRVKRDEQEAWRVFLPEVKQGKWYFHELFVDGQRRQRARSPNTAFYFTDGSISAENPARFKSRPQDFQASWGQGGDAEVVALLKWADLRLPIKSVDGATRTITLSQKRQEFGDDPSARYWIENSFAALDAPGEWYLDRRQGNLFYKALLGEDSRRTVMVAPVLQQLVRFVGDPSNDRFVHDLTLRGFTFAYTDWNMPPNGYVDMQAAYDRPAAVEMTGATNCSLDECLFTHLGQYAVEIHHGSKGNRVVGNEMTDLGAGGVKIGDPQIANDDKQATRGNVILDNHIHDIGRVYPAAVGVWIGQSGGNTVAHNEINDTYYTAISVGWTWGYGPTAARDNVLEFNSLHDIGRGMLSDMGCIYTLGVQPGTVERNNLCHDVTRYVHGYGGWGLYTDEGSSNILIENNIVYRAEDGGFHQHYGRENTVRNNIFAFGRTAEIRRTRQEPHTSFTFEHNLVYWELGALLDGEWDDNNFRFDNNLYYRTGGQAFQFGKWSFEEWKKHGQDEHSQVNDPMFVDAENADFSLKPGSPAGQIDFHAIDVNQVGPRQ